MPDNVKILKKNVEQNHLKNVEVVHGFVGKTKGEREVFFNRKLPGGSTGMRHVAESKGSNRYEKYVVPEILLSDFISEDIDLLKMDVEGAEGEILSEISAAGKIKRIKQIVLEYHQNPENTNNKLGSLLDILEKNNFKYIVYKNEPASIEFEIYNHFMIRAFASSYFLLNR